MDISKWLSIVTNLGVLVGLILVAYQINQTNDALRQQSLSMQVEAYRAGDEISGGFYRDLAFDADLASIWRRGNGMEEMDDLEAYRYRQLAYYYFHSQQALFAVWNALGEGRGGFAVNDLQADISLYPGLRAAYVEFRRDEGERSKRGHYREPSSESIKLNRGHFELVDEVLKQ